MRLKKPIKISSIGTKIIFLGILFIVLALTVPCTPVSAYTPNVYSVTGATAYAAHWASSRNSHYADYTGQGGDCANFVSQCLIAGGITLWKGTNGAGYGVNSYGCMPFCDYLHTNLYSYQSKTNYGRYVQSGSWDYELPSWVSPGTVLMYGTAGGDEYRHAVIVVEGTGDSARVASHTADGIYSWTRWSSYNVVRAYKLSGYTSTYYAVRITASSLNVRAGPSTSYGILKTIQNGEKYVRIESYNGWYRIWLDDRSAWISGSYADSYSLSSYYCYRVTASSLNVRTGPSTGYSIVGTCHYGQCFIRSDVSGSWYKIYYSSGSYWSSSNYLSRIT